MDERIRTLMAELRVGLEETYGEDLEGIYLYGSYALGKEDSESDVDVIVVLDDFESYAAEIDRIGPLGAALSLKYGVSISKVFVRKRDWLGKETPFLINAREEAVRS
jgi:predicted nucleotidyltransferase